MINFRIFFLRNEPYIVLLGYLPYQQLQRVEVFFLWLQAAYKTTGMLHLRDLMLGCREGVGDK